jgi:hypothetical protein
MKKKVDVICLICDCFIEKIEVDETYEKPFTYAECIFCGWERKEKENGLIK